MKITMYGAVVGVGKGWTEARELIDSWIKSQTHKHYDDWFIDNEGVVFVVLDWGYPDLERVGKVE